jgi:glycosyltransferase involved in cell wall biosynthesis
MTHLVFVVNVDWFFKSHRLPLAIEALNRGYMVSLVTENTGLFEEFTSYGIHCYEIKFGRGYSNPFNELFKIFKLYKYYKALQPNIVHHVTLKPYLYGSLILRLFKFNILNVIAVTGLGYLFTSKKTSFLGKILKFSLKFAISKKNKTKFIFQNCDDFIFFDQLLKLNSKDVFLIKGSGVDHYIFQRKPNYPRNESNKKRITLVARILRDKGIIEFIKAAKLLKEKLYGECLFVIVGDIDILNPSSISEFELLKLLDNDYIVWMGFKDNVKDVYEDSYLACMPSYREGLPKSLVEAMAMSLPIITTDAPGCKECVEEGVNGFLVPIGDYYILSNKIYQLVKNEKLRNSMGLASRRKMELEMSLSTIIQQTFSVYES